MHNNPNYAMRLSISHFRIYILSQSEVNVIDNWKRNTKVQSLRMF